MSVIRPEIQELLKRKIMSDDDYYEAAESLLSCGAKNGLALEEVEQFIAEQAA